MPNKIGICQWCLPGDPKTICSHAAALGLRGIELNFSGDWKNHALNSPQVRKELLGRAGDSGIEFPTLGLNVFCDLNMFDPDNGEAMKEIFRRAVDIAVSMGIRVLQVPSFGKSAIGNDKELERAIGAFDYACSLAKDEDLVIGSENALSLEENLKIVRSLSSDKIRVYFDTQNPHVVNGYRVPDMVGPLYPHICEVHAKDGKDGIMGNTLLGKGEASFRETMERLCEKHYSGWVILENIYVSDDEIGADLQTLADL